MSKEKERKKRGGKGEKGVKGEKRVKGEIQIKEREKKGKQKGEHFYFKLLNLQEYLNHVLMMKPFPEDVGVDNRC